MKQKTAVIPAGEDAALAILRRQGAPQLRCADGSLRLRRGDLAALKRAGRLTF